MASIKESLGKAMEMDGAIGVALADYDSGMCLGTAGGREGFNLEVATAGNSEVIRSKHKVMKEIGLQDQVEDILISLGTEYHLILLLPGTTLFLYATLSRERSNLALARHKLRSVGKSLEV